MNDLIKQIDDWFTEADENRVENISDVGELRNMLLEAREQLANAKTAVAVVERLKEMIPEVDESNHEDWSHIRLFHRRGKFRVIDGGLYGPYGNIDSQGPTLEAAVLGDGMEEKE